MMSPGPRFVKKYDPSRGITDAGPCLAESLKATYEMRHNMTEESVVDFLDDVIKPFDDVTSVNSGEKFYFKKQPAPVKKQPATVKKQPALINKEPVAINKEPVAIIKHQPTEARQSVRKEFVFQIPIRQTKKRTPSQKPTPVQQTTLKIVASDPAPYSKSFNKTPSKRVDNFDSVTSQNYVANIQTVKKPATVMLSDKSTTSADEKQLINFESYIEIKKQQTSDSRKVDSKQFSLPTKAKNLAKATAQMNATKSLDRPRKSHANNNKLINIEIYKTLDQQQPKLVTKDVMSVKPSTVKSSNAGRETFMMY